MIEVVRHMRTAIWLYLFMFVAFFDLHAQYPILSPFALSLGAAPSFIGLIMGVYSITHLPGNLIAGYGVDKYGSKMFIVFSLIVAGIILLFQSNVKDPWHLLYIRSISGFVLAFLSPACLSLACSHCARSHSSEQADGWQRPCSHAGVCRFSCGRSCLSGQNRLHNCFFRVRLDSDYHRNSGHLRCKREGTLS